MADAMHIVMSVNAAWNILNFRRHLVEALLTDGHRVTILAPRDDAAERLEAIGCRFVDLAMDPKGLNPLRDIKLIYRFWRHFRELQPDTVLGFTIKNNLFGAPVARALKIPFVPNVTGMGTAFLGKRLLAAVARLLYRNAFRHLDCVYFQNPDDRLYFLKHQLVSDPRARLLPGSGVDLQHFAPEPLRPDKRETVFVMISRLLRDKGVYEYVEAARRLRHAGVEARFLLLGPLGAENRTAIAREELDEWLSQGIIEYLGTHDDVRPAIAASDCIVLPSYREGAPRTLIEGAAMGRPAVTTDVPGCSFVVDDGKTGFLCEAKDAASLAAALERFTSLDYKSRERMGKAARLKMELEFDVSLVIQSYRETIERFSARGKLRDTSTLPAGAD